jgi:hypothetical protein
MTLHKCIRCGHRAISLYTSVRIRNSNLEKIKARARTYNQSVDDLITESPGMKSKRTKEVGKAITIISPTTTRRGRKVSAQLLLRSWNKALEIVNDAIKSNKESGAKFAWTYKFRLLVTNTVFL